MQSNFETIDFLALDGFKCNLKHYLQNQPSKCPVMLVHGAGVRADIFCPPTEMNLVETLAKEGYDVWLENWRGSIEFQPNKWDLDQVAKFDHPAAVKKVLELTGASEIKVIIHCQGSTSFMISVVLGLVPEVTTIISNAVSLHPIVPRFSVFKSRFLVPIVSRFFEYISPKWGNVAPDFKSKLMRLMVLLTHPEKDTKVGKFVSFTYGSGFPALWLLENLDEKTMKWIEEEFAEVPISFFEHIGQCIKQGVLVPNEPGISTYAPQHHQFSPRIVLFGGIRNLCFLPQSQQATFDYLEKCQPGKHKLYLLDDYSHLDVFLGKASNKDVFPLMIDELNKN
ncbi:alpha/beta fold hydrolase [Echinicola sp. 20G]|uniref:alpha/beta fold hydrolase n=1 Tax=Echinicola sp. 20G TaxID=2781961 RepID=UPI0019100422|nr:alpha/beta fold hydrolase [Echinicola sp. 20G]